VRFERFRRRLKNGRPGVRRRIGRRKVDGLEKVYEGGELEKGVEVVGVGRRVHLDEGRFLI